MGLSIPSTCFNTSIIFVALSVAFNRKNVCYYRERLHCCCIFFALNIITATIYQMDHRDNSNERTHLSSSSFNPTFSLMTSLLNPKPIGRGILLGFSFRYHSVLKFFCYLRSKICERVCYKMLTLLAYS